MNSSENFQSLELVMKKFLLLPLALAFASNAAMAANSVDLRVTGTITPAACDISLTGGDFDLGAISGKDLSATKTTVFPEMTGKTLSIACSGATQVAFKAIDNRETSTPSSLPFQGTLFGLGTDSQGAPIGAYQLRVYQPSILVDGSTGYIKTKVDGAGYWGSYGYPSVHLNSYNVSPTLYALDAGPVGGGAQPLPMTNASAGLKMVAAIQPENTLDTSTDITIDGSATFELVYL
ncbi:DUF1120 domain-containing protein [Pseudomonas sp. NPDC098747]|uniref:DUF1120 domain-containing protein n=1 Tax=Pseudomonas sp. NPDC098747 TaxID=3364487 RepID=UPI00383AEF61